MRERQTGRAREGRHPDRRRPRRRSPSLHVLQQHGLDPGIGTCARRKWVGGGCARWAPGGCYWGVLCGLGGRPGRCRGASAADASIDSLTSGRQTATGSAFSALVYSRPLHRFRTSSSPRPCRWSPTWRYGPSSSFGRDHANGRAWAGYTVSPCLISCQPARLPLDGDARQHVRGSGPPRAGCRWCSRPHEATRATRRTRDGSVREPGSDSTVPTNWRSPLAPSARRRMICGVSMAFPRWWWLAWDPSTGGRVRTVEPLRFRKADTDPIDGIDRRVSMPAHAREG